MPRTKTADDQISDRLLGRNRGFALESTDRETVIQYSAVDTPSLVSLIPPRRLLAILGELTGETVDVSLKRSLLVVADDAARFELAAPEPADFPAAKHFDGGRWYTVDCAELKAALALPLFATADSAGRYAIEGVLLEFADADMLLLVATDSRRMSVTTYKIRM